MTRRERIIVLLEFYRDVEDGFADRGFNDERVIGMCRAWNHTSYYRLRALLAELMHEDSAAWQAVTIRYTRWAETRVAAFCKVCGDHPAQAVEKTHRHGGKVVTLVPRSRRVFRNFSEKNLQKSFDFLEARWGGDEHLPVLPPDIIANIAGRASAGEYEDRRRAAKVVA